MSETRQPFRLIDDTTAATGPGSAPAPTPDEQSRRLLMIALRSLGQRATTALTNGFSLILVISVWLLASRIMTEPSINQMYALFGYATFCLLIDIARRRNK